jgi:hypothetical protein
MMIACVGKRNIDYFEYQTLAHIGKFLVDKGHDIVSGNAPGSDFAFQTGGNSVKPERVRIYLPFPSFRPEGLLRKNKVTSQPIPSDYVGASIVWRLRRPGYPPWESLSYTTQSFMARNFGMADVAERLIAAPKFGPNGEPTGGTGFMIQCFEHLHPDLDAEVQILDFNKKDPKWDICPDCTLGRTLWNCGSPYHSLKAYA